MKNKNCELKRKLLLIYKKILMIFLKYKISRILLNIHIKHFDIIMGLNVPTRPMMVNIVKTLKKYIDQLQQIAIMLI